MRVIRKPLVPHRPGKARKKIRRVLAACSAVVMLSAGGLPAQEEKPVELVPVLKINKVTLLPPFLFLSSTLS